MLIFYNIICFSSFSAKAFWGCQFCIGCRRNVGDCQHCLGISFNLPHCLNRKFTVTLILIWTKEKDVGLTMYYDIYTSISNSWSCLHVIHYERSQQIEFIKRCLVSEPNTTVLLARHNISTFSSWVVRFQSLAIASRSEASSCPWKGSACPRDFLSHPNSSVSLRAVS